MSNDEIETDEQTSAPINRLEQRADSKPEEISEAEQPAFQDLDVEPPRAPVRLKIDPPVEYDGKTYSEIICDFDALTGNDFRRCEREFTRLYKPDRNEVVLPEMKPDYHISLIVAAAEKANCFVPRGLILKLPGRYYNPLRNECLKVYGGAPEKESR